MKNIQETITKKATPEEILYSELNNVALEIGSKLDAAKPARENYDHSQNNWASEISHPCLKHLVHCRLDWRKRQPIELDGRWRVDEGKRIEWEIKKILGDIGYEITKSQRKYSTDDPGLEKFKALKITCKIDGVSPLNKELPPPFEGLREIPVEIKSVNPNYWNSTKTIEDINRHSKFWIRKMTSQLNIGIVLSRRPGGLLIIVTFGKKPRIIPMLFDSELWEYDSRRARKVNAHIKAGTYPAPMPFDATICGMCDFNHICTPLKTTDYLEIPDINEIELQTYLELKDWHNKYVEMKEELIGNKKKPGKYFGKKAIVGEIEISTRNYMKKVHKIPPEVKQKYYVHDEEVTITAIERIAK